MPQQMLEARAAATKAGELEENARQQDAARRAAAKAQTEREEGLAEFKKVSEDPTKKPSINPMHAYLAGYPLGALIGAGVGALFGRAARKPARAADKLLAEPIPRTIKDQAGAVNEVWRLGGAKQPPFVRAEGRNPIPAVAPNPQAPPTSELFPKPSAKNEWMTQGGLTGFWGLDSAITQWMAYNAEQRKLQAEKDLQVKPNAATIQAWLDAREAANNWEAATNGFRAMALGNASTAKLMPALRGDAKPTNLAQADARRFDVDEKITKKKGEVADYNRQAAIDRAADKQRREARAARAAARTATPKKPKGSGGVGPAGTAGAGLLLPTPLGEPPEAAPLSYPLGTLDDSVGDYQPYRTGGKVNGEFKRDKHHSYYQPRKIGRFAGGPVYPGRGDGGKVRREEGFIGKPHDDYALYDFADDENPLAAGYERDARAHRMNRNLAIGASAIPSAAIAAHIWPGLSPKYGMAGPTIAASSVTGPILGTLWYAAKEAAGDQGNKMRAAEDAAHMWSNTGLPGRPERDLGHYESAREASGEKMSLEELMAAIGSLKGLAGGDPLSSTAPTPEGRGKTGGWATGGDVGGAPAEAPHVAGPVHGPGGGRADDVNMKVKSGSYVIPADCVSGLQGAGGNTNAGMAQLERMFGPPDPAALASGGDVPIKISDGEFVVSPDQVAKIGGGDLEHGHRVLDAFVKRCRAEHIKTLSKLPGPAR
jgi:hypothetical protein